MRIAAHGLVLIVLFAICCRNPAGPTDAHNPKDILSRVAADTGLVLPDGTAVVRFSDPDKIVDPVWAAKLIIPSSSYEGFRASLLKKESNSTIVSGGSGLPSWWKPVKVVLTRQYLADRSTLVRIAVAEEHDAFAVYIECIVF